MKKIFSWSAIGLVCGAAQAHVHHAEQPDAEREFGIRHIF